MANYPTLPQCEGSRLVPRSGLRMRYASNGTVRARALASATRYDPVIQHNLLTLSDWATLQAFYEANRGIPVTVVYCPNGENLTLTCLFADKPIDYKLDAAGNVNATVYLVQSN